MTLLRGGLVQKQAVNEVLRCNAETEEWGLTLTEEQAVQLIETRSYSLKESGRVEFGGGIVEKIILEFKDSPYLSKHNYEETLHGLIEIFYYYKNETLDMIGDDELIRYMKTSFDEVCQGSLELLSDRELYKLARSLRFGEGVPAVRAKEKQAADENRGRGEGEYADD